MDYALGSWLIGLRGLLGMEDVDMQRTMPPVRELAVWLGSLKEKTLLAIHTAAPELVWSG